MFAGSRVSPHILEDSHDNSAARFKSSPNGKIATPTKALNWPSAVFPPCQEPKVGDIRASSCNTGKQGELRQCMRAEKLAGYSCRTSPAIYAGLGLVQTDTRAPL